MMEPIELVIQELASFIGLLVVSLIWYQDGIKRIKDLLNENKEFLSYDLFCENFDLNTPLIRLHNITV